MESPLESNTSQAPFQVVSTTNAPAAIGPYSQAVISQGFVFCSGSIGLDPVTMKLIGPDVESQTMQVLTNLKNVLAAAGSSLSHVVKTTILLTDIADFAKVNAIYSEFFPSNPPARATYAVAALPAGALVEIEAIAAVPSKL